MSKRWWTIHVPFIVVTFDAKGLYRQEVDMPHIEREAPKFIRALRYIGEQKGFVPLVTEKEVVHQWRKEALRQIREEEGEG